MEVLHALSNPPPSFAKLGRRTREPDCQRPEPVVRPKQHQTRLDGEQRAELVRRYVAGERAFKLAEHFNVHRSTVGDILVEADVKRPRSMTPTEVAEAVERYEDGASCALIGELLIALRASWKL